MRKLTQAQQIAITATATFLANSAEVRYSGIYDATTNSHLSHHEKSKLIRDDLIEFYADFLPRYILSAEQEIKAKIAVIFES